MRLPYPVICKRCHVNKTSYIDEICDTCFLNDQCKEDLFCPSCNTKLDKKVFYLSNKRFAYYICPKCGHVIINNDTIRAIISIKSIKDIIDIT